MTSKTKSKDDWSTIEILCFFLILMLIASLSITFTIMVEDGNNKCKQSVITSGWTNISDVYFDPFRMVCVADCYGSSLCKEVIISVFETNNPDIKGTKIG